MRRYSPEKPGPVANSFARYVVEHYGVEISPSQAQALFSYHNEWQRWRNAPGGEAEQEKQAREPKQTQPKLAEQREVEAPVHGNAGHSVAGGAGRQMVGPEFRQHPHAPQVTEAHVAPINRFVAQLQNRDGRGWLPDVPPTCGGVDAKVLTVLRDPGKDTLRSGFLSAENRDPTTAAQLALLGKFGISPRDILPWNAYPWFINRKLGVDDLAAGAEVLGDVIDLAPHLRVVLLQGNEAARAWERVVRWRPRLVEERGLEVVRCIHPSPNALRFCSESEREERKLKQQDAYRRVAEILATSAAIRSGRHSSPNARTLAPTPRTVRGNSVGS